MESCLRLGITAVALTADNIREDPTIVWRAAQGEYAIIYMPPEFMSKDEERFGLLWRSAIIQSNLVGVVVDEAHLCHGW